MKEFKGKAALMAPMVIKLIFGIMMIIDYKMVFDLIMNIAGIIFVVLGLVNLVGYFKDGKISTAKLTSAIILLGLGLVLFVAGGTILKALNDFLTIILGVILLIIAVAQLQMVLDLKKMGLKPGIFEIISLVVLFALAIIAIVAHNTVSKTLWLVVGVILCVNAVLDIVSLFGFKKVEINEDGTIEGEAEEIK